MSEAGEKVRIVFLDRDTLSPETRLREIGFPHTLTVFDRTKPEEVAGRIADAEVVVTNKVPVRAEAIAAAPNLRMIAVCATGTDMVDLNACAERGIVVSNARGYAVRSVPEHTFALILALRRSIVAYRESVKAGRWQEAAQFCFFDHPIRDLNGSTIGIIGAGTLGKAVAELAKAFGMTVLFASRKGTPLRPHQTPFEELLRRSDVITLHVPLSAETRGMIDREQFALMERHPLLINASRGGLVDEAALYDALTSGRISGAGFDVASAEPPPQDHTLMKLLALPNFILTPHVAWASREAIQALADQLVDNIEAFQRGSPRNVVG